jgi:8-oxo-dGTP diphosphatase
MPYSRKLAPAGDASTWRFQLIADVHLVLVDSDGRVLLGRRQNTGFADGAFHLPSGHLEAGESVVAALIREAREETGLTIGPEQVEFAHVMHDGEGAGRVHFFFFVRQWSGTPVNREPDKCSELGWFAFDQLPEPIVAYCRAALTHIAAGQQFSLYGW